MPICDALTRSAPIVRLVALEIFSTGVRAFECLLSSRISAAVHSRRNDFFVLVLTVLNFGSDFVRTALLAAVCRHHN
jgi:hypothetical protein